MKVKREHEKETFNPVTISITFETANELRVFKSELHCISNGAYETLSTFDPMCEKILNILK